VVLSRELLEIEIEITLSLTFVRGLPTFQVTMGMEFPATARKG
jgi:hypothetical protein